MQNIYCAAGKGAYAWAGCDDTGQIEGIRSRDAERNIISRFA
jgi:hypothetical protein